MGSKHKWLLILLITIVLLVFVGCEFGIVPTTIDYPSKCFFNSSEIECIDFYINESSKEIYLLLSSVNLLTIQNITLAIHECDGVSRVEKAQNSQAVDVRISECSLRANENDFYNLFPTLSFTLSNNVSRDNVQGHILLKRE